MKPDPELETALFGCDDARHPSWADKTQAALARLASHGLTRIRGLLAALHGLEPPLLLDAIYIVGRLERPRDVDTLIGLFGVHESDEVKHEITDALAEIGGSVAGWFLATRVADRSLATKLRWVACNHLNSCSSDYDESVVAALLAVAGSAEEDEDLRGQALESLCCHVDRDEGPREAWDRAAALFEASLADPSGEVRFWAIFGVGQLGLDGALPRLQRLVETDDHVASLGWENREEARDVVHKLTTGEWLEPDASERARLRGPAPEPGDESA